MPEPIYQATQFIIQTVTNLYTLLVCLRVTLDWAHTSYANPLFLSINRITAPFLRPIYRIVPAFNGIDLAALILLSTLSMSKIGMLFWWQTGHIPSLTGLMLLAVAEVLKHFVDIFLFMIIAFSLMSWFNPLVAPAMVEIIVKVTKPLLRLTQGRMPAIFGLDFSPLFTMVGLKLIMVLIVAPLMQRSIMLLERS